MTRLSMSVGATLMMFSLAPAAYAYEISPHEDTLRNLTQLSFDLPQYAALEGTCQVKVTPEVASILGFPSDWRDSDNRTHTALACHDG